MDVIKSLLETTTIGNRIIAGNGNTSSSSSKKLQLEYNHPEEDWPYIWAIRNGETLDWKNDCETDEEIFEIAMQQQYLPVKIADGLYLGDSTCIQDTILDEEDGDNFKEIGYILNMAGHDVVTRKTVNQLRKRNITYKVIPCLDQIDYPLLEKHWYDAYEYIQKATTTSNTKISRGNAVLVHCRVGWNRSVLIIAAYYMMTTQTPILQTIQHIRKLRGNSALQNEGFQIQLVSFARKYNLLDNSSDSTLLPSNIPPISQLP